MKFVIDRDCLGSGLQQVLNIISSRPSLPILNNVCLEAKKESLQLTASNLDQGITSELKARVEVEGSLTLPAKKLSSIVRSLPNASVNIESFPSLQTRIVSGTSQFRLMGLDSSEFPFLPKIEGGNAIQLQQQSLLEAIRRVSFAQSTDESRYLLNGVFFEFENEEWKAVATDGRRLSLVKNLRIEGEKAKKSEFVLPSKSIAELERLLGIGKNVQLVVAPNWVAFTLEVEESENAGFMGSIQFVSKIIEGNYPNYETVLPKERFKSILLDRNLFLSSLQRAALVVNDRSNIVRLNIKEQQLEVLANNQELGEFFEILPLELPEGHQKGALDKENLTLTFNPSFLQDPLRALSDKQVLFEFRDETSQGVFKSGDTFTYVVMPLRS